jgi:hypothetical protein
MWDGIDVPVVDDPSAENPLHSRRVLVPIGVPGSCTANVSVSEGRGGNNKVHKFSYAAHGVEAAYAVTVWKCQGSTLDRVVLMLDRAPGGQSVSTEGLYVALTRAREFSHIRHLTTLSDSVKTSIFNLTHSLSTTRWLAGYNAAGRWHGAAKFASLGVVAAADQSGQQQQQQQQANHASVSVPRRPQPQRSATASGKGKGKGKGRGRGRGKDKGKAREQETEGQDGQDTDSDTLTVQGSGTRTVSATGNRTVSGSGTGSGSGSGTGSGSGSGTGSGSGSGNRTVSATGNRAVSGSGTGSGSGSGTGSGNATISEKGKERASPPPAPSTNGESSLSSASSFVRQLLQGSTGPGPRTGPAGNTRSRR